MSQEKLDPRRLLVAAHELGHVVAMRAAHIGITEVRVGGHGERVYGFVRPNNSDDEAAIQDPHRARACLATHLAGYYAESAWCKRHGLPFNASASDADVRVFNKRRKHAALTGVTTDQIKADARRLVRAQWGYILRNAPKLARRGWLHA